MERLIRSLSPCAVLSAPKVKELKKVLNDKEHQSYLSKKKKRKKQSTLIPHLIDRFDV